MATITGSRTPLFYKKIPGGLPVLLDASKFTGNIFYVDSAVGTDSVGYGSTPDAPFDSIDYAVGQCVANQGDVILVLPGHAETINAAAAIDLDVAGISVIGLGNGEDRPTITIGSTEDASTVEIGAADILVRNMIFQPGNDGVDILLDINADGAIIEDCEFRSDETNAYQADTYIDINGGGANAADRVTLRRCKITSITAGAAQAINIAAVEDALVVEDCWIDGDFSAAGILSGSIFTNALIRRNIVSNRAAGVHAIEFTAACTGMLVDNRMYSSTLGTILDPGSLKCLGNLETDAVDQAGVDSPRTSAGGFADNSITAAAIATDAIDADAIADNAIDADVIAADAITNAKIADAALSEEQFDADAAARLRLGIKVTRAAADIIDGTQKALFTVADGKVLLTHLQMVISGAALDAGANNGNFKTNPTTGADMNLCADLDLVAAAIGAVFSISGIITDAMTGPVAGGGAMAMQRGIILAPGTVDIVTAGDKGTGGGLGAVELWYIPLDTGATVVTA